MKVEKEGREALEKIEILSEELFESHREEMEIVERFQERFNAMLGWHYYLDLAFILRQIRESLHPGAMILDAGAGSGMLQLMLAELGYNVISADFVGRSLPESYLARYGAVVHPLNSQKSSLDNSYTRHLASVYGGRAPGLLARLGRLIGSGRSERGSLEPLERHRFIPGTFERQPLFQGEARESCGRIFLYKCDLQQMPLLPDGLVDAVVSLSALEHNSHDCFGACLKELLRVTRDGGKLVLTVSASQGEDWFHTPSKGWCYSEATLKMLCDLPEEVVSNFRRKDELFARLARGGGELEKRLDPAYFQSGDNGMPWGNWEPQYQPVGVVKVKGRAS